MKKLSTLEIVLLVLIIPIQAVAGIIFLIVSKGNMVLALLPTAVLATYLLIKKSKHKWIQLSTIGLVAIYTCAIFPPGTFSFKPHFIPMPIQQHVHVENGDTTLQESVLIENLPKDASALSAVMAAYFDKVTKNEDACMYTSRSITFYESTMDTRVFISSTKDPYDLANIYLEDMYSYRLGYACTEKKDSTVTKYVSYRTSYSEVYGGDYIATDTLEKRVCP